MRRETKKCEDEDKKNKKNVFFNNIIIIIVIGYLEKIYYQSIHILKNNTNYPVIFNHI